MEDEYEVPELKPMFVNSANAMLLPTFAVEVVAAAVAIAVYVAIAVSVVIVNDSAE